jgi:hypothetical protein
MSKLRRVFFTSQRAIERMDGKPYCGLISITGPGAPLAVLKGPWGRVLRISFSDEEPVSVPPLSDGAEVFSPGHAEMITRFVRTLPESVDVLAVHCLAGVSRSGGVAKAIAYAQEIYFPPDYHEYNRHVFRTLLISLIDARDQTLRTIMSVRSRGAASLSAK